MENPPEQPPQPEWITQVQAALDKYRAMSGKQRKAKLPATYRDVHRELSWHEHERSEGKLNNEQYWKAVGQTLHDHGLYDMMWGTPTS